MTQTTDKLETLIRVLAKLDPINTGCNYSKNIYASDEYFPFAEYAIELMQNSKFDIYSAIEYALDELALYRNKLTHQQREYINENFLRIYN